MPTPIIKRRFKLKPRPRLHLSHAMPFAMNVALMTRSDSVFQGPMHARMSSPRGPRTTGERSGEPIGPSGSTTIVRRGGGSDQRMAQLGSQRFTQRPANVPARSQLASYFTKKSPRKSLPSGSVLNLDDDIEECKSSEDEVLPVAPLSNSQRIHSKRRASEPQRVLTPQKFRAPQRVSEAPQSTRSRPSRPPQRTTQAYRKPKPPSARIPELSVVDLEYVPPPASNAAPVITPSKKKRKIPESPSENRNQKRKMDKDGLQGAILEISSDDGSEKSSRLKKKHSAKRSVRKKGQTRYRTILAEAFSPSQERNQYSSREAITELASRKGGGAGRKSSPSISAGDAPSESRKIRERSNSQAHPSERDLDPFCFRGERRSGQPTDIMPPTGNDGGIGGEMNSVGSGPTLSNEVTIVDSTSIPELMSRKTSTSPGKRKKKSVRELPSEGKREPGRLPREFRSSTGQSPESGVRPIVVTPSPPTKKMVEVQEIIVISDEEDKMCESTTDDADALAMHLREVDISDPEIPADSFYGTRRPSEPVQHKRRTRRRSKRIVETSESDDDIAPGGDIRLREPSKKEQALIQEMTFGGARDRVVSKIVEARIDLRAGDFACLRASRWLSDEIMNSFVALVNARNTEHFASTAGKSNERKPEMAGTDPDVVEIVHHNISTPPFIGNAGPEIPFFKLPRPRTHVFNTFFFARLTQNGYDYGGVKRWLKKAKKDVSELDLVMFPINIRNLHWVLAAIDIRRKRFLYFDSTFGLDSLMALPKLRQWLHDETRDKHGEEAAAAMKLDTWMNQLNPEYQPHQEDGGSCGIFALYMAEYLERAVRPDFQQRDIRVLRQRTALFLRDGRLPQ